jgi:hypothetical protein
LFHMEFLWSPLTMDNKDLCNTLWDGGEERIEMFHHRT